MPFTVPSGQPDSFFISQVRRGLKEQATWFSETYPTDGVQGSVLAGSKPFRLKRSPVLIGSVVADKAGALVVVYDVAPTGTQVSVVSETGEFYFLTTPPVSQTIKMTYRAFRYSDAQILDALQEGLWEMWPDIWLPATDTSLIYSPMITEYTLPAAFNDPRIQIVSLEMQPPAGILVSVPTGMYRRQGLTNLVVLKEWPSGTIMRITYNSPYVALADLEGQLVNLPTYYACYKILMDQESIGTRVNDLPAQTGDSAATPERASKTAQLWLQRFEQARQRLSIPAPHNRMVMGRAVEMMGKGFTWDPLG